jgi:hypothetical protein|tara:strand:+ start:39 stop:491 length:453 start_codon:yes stop_codon:yes gene_type:complete
MADQTELMDQLLKRGAPTPKERTGAAIPSREMTGAAISPREMDNTQAQAQMDIENEIARAIRERTGAAASQSEIQAMISSMNPLAQRDEMNSKRRLVELLLRNATGAAVPQSEVEAYINNPLAMRSLLEEFLRKQTGAAVSQSEVDNILN